MKKALIALSIFALVASVATAQITFGAWGRTMFVPIANSGADGAESVATLSPSWGVGGGGRIGFTIAGNSDNVGFQIDMNGDNGGINPGDQQKMWVKPMDMLKIEVGTVQDDTLRGNAAFGSWNWFRFMAPNIQGEDVTFTRLSTAPLSHKHYGNTQGVLVTVKPMEALFIGLALDNINTSLDITGDTPANNDSNFTSNLVKNSQIAAGYTIEGIGQIRAQYLSEYTGAAGTDDGDVKTRIEAAFKMTAVENLYVDVGVKKTTSEVAADEKTEIAAYANYKVSGAVIHALLNYNMLEDDNQMGIGVGVDYSLEGGIGLAADVRYYDDKWDSVGKAMTTFGAFATKGFSNGLIGAGVQVFSQEDMAYAIPVRFEYWF